MREISGEEMGKASAKKVDGSWNENGVVMELVRWFDDSGNKIKLSNKTVTFISAQS